MIIGAGDISSAIIDREDITFFASGVSNSRETNNDEFIREMRLLMNQPINKHFVYFSSLSIYYGEKTPYIGHKKHMEAIIKALFTSYTIIRIGNISWGKNPDTLINYLKAHPEAEIQKVYRHIVDKDEFQYWLNLIPVGQKNEMNIPGKMVWVPDLVSDPIYRHDCFQQINKPKGPSAPCPDEQSYEIKGI